MWLCGWLAAARAENTPQITGDGKPWITAADVANLDAFARTLAGNDPGALARVDARQHPPFRDFPAGLGSAVVYFEPYEAEATHWRGRAKLFQATDYNPIPYPTTVARASVGRWATLGGDELVDYLILPPKGGSLPKSFAGGMEGYRAISINSDLDSSVILGAIETARGFSFVQKDGSELPFANAAIWEISTSKQGAAIPSAFVSMAPAGERPFYLRLRQEKNGWRITKVSRSLCDGYF